MTTDTTEKYADKIAKLLAKAKSTPSLDEADAFIAKAQELMTLYAIDDAMIAAHGNKPREEIIQTQIFYTGPQAFEQMNLGNSICNRNTCRCLYIQSYDKKKITLTVTGFESDVTRATVLEASIQAQMMRAMGEYEMGNPEFTRMAFAKRNKDRQSFVIGYDSAVSTRLAQANQRAKDEAEKREADRSQVDSQVASDSVALVLRSRKDSVDDWMDKRYGKLRGGRGRRYSYGSAYSSGHEAGKRANLGNTVGGGGTRQIAR